MNYAQVTKNLRASYDRSAAERNRQQLSSWKRSERRAFLELLRREGKTRLLEVGAGPGRDSLYFQDQGLHVVSSDLSPEMVQLCREKGLEAYQRDFLHLGFEQGQFDAVYALNCLLHVPKADLGKVLMEIRRVMAPGGLFFMGVYGGKAYEGTLEQDVQEPKRFFANYPDEQIKEFVAEHFALLDFKKIYLPEKNRSGLHFQRLLLRREAN